MHSHAASEAKRVDLLAGEEWKVSLVHGLAAQELTQRLAIALRAGEACQRALAFYLRDMEVRRVHQELGYASAVQFAMNRLGMSKGRARELLRVGRRLEELVALDAAFARGELAWSKVRRIARVATKENEVRWIERCRDLSAEQVESLTGCVREGDDPPAIDRGLPQARFVKRFWLDALEHELFEQAREKLVSELGRAVADDELLSELVRLFLSSQADGSVPGRKAVDASLFRVLVRSSDALESARHAVRAEHDAIPLPEERIGTIATDATLPVRLRRRILDRDGRRCRHCGSSRSLMVHHVLWRSHGGGNHPDNLLTLCARCHGLVHERYLVIEGRQATGFRFTDREGWELS